MDDVEGTMYPLEVKIGITRTVCYLGCQAEFDTAQGFANFLAVVQGGRTQVPLFSR